MSLSRWCASQPDLVRYRGECLIYRAEIMQWRGNWNGAEQDARDACELLPPGRGGPVRPSTGLAKSTGFAVSSRRRKQPTRVRTSADESRCQDCRCFGSLRATSITRLRRSGVFSSTRLHRAARARILAAAVEILLVADDLEGARAADGAPRIANSIGAPLLSGCLSTRHGRGSPCRRRYRSSFDIAAAGVRNLAGSGNAIRRGANLCAAGDCL